MAKDADDFINNGQAKTFYTKETFLPNILVEIGAVKSKSEIRRNKPELFITLDKIDCLEVKRGKQKLYIVRGELRNEKEN